MNQVYGQRICRRVAPFGAVLAGHSEGLIAKTEDGFAFHPAATRWYWMTDRQEPLDQNIGKIVVNSYLAEKGETLQLDHTIVL